MPGLIIVVAGRDPERFHAALSLAAANAALGQRSRIFLQGDAAALLGDTGSETDDHYVRHGVPTLRQLFEEAQALGVEIIVCQSGLALAGLQADQLPNGVSTGGLVELLATGGQDQLLMA
jgi:predicted peroxiredoxin